MPMPIVAVNAAIRLAQLSRILQKCFLCHLTTTFQLALTPQETVL